MIVLQNELYNVTSIFCHTGDILQILCKLVDSTWCLDFMSEITDTSQKVDCPSINFPHNSYLLIFQFDSASKSYSST